MQKKKTFLNGRRSMLKFLLKPVPNCFSVAEMSFAKRGKSSKAKVPKAQLAARANWRSPSTPQTAEIPSGDSINNTAFRNKTAWWYLKIQGWNPVSLKHCPNLDCYATRMSESPECFHGLFNCNSLTQAHHKNCLASPDLFLNTGHPDWFGLKHPGRIPSDLPDHPACHSLSWVVLKGNDIHPKWSPCFNIETCVLTPANPFNTTPISKPMGLVWLSSA